MLLKPIAQTFLVIMLSQRPRPLSKVLLVTQQSLRRSAAIRLTSRSCRDGTGR